MFLFHSVNCIVQGIELPKTFSRSKHKLLEMKTSKNWIKANISMLLFQFPKMCRFIDLCDSSKQLHTKILLFWSFCCEIRILYSISFNLMYDITCFGLGKPTLYPIFSDDFRRPTFTQISQNPPVSQATLHDTPS